MKLKDSPHIREVLASLGDSSVPDYDGGFVFIHEQTGEAEFEYVEAPATDNWDCPQCSGMGNGPCDDPYPYPESHDWACEHDTCHDTCEVPDGFDWTGQWSCIHCRGTGKNPELRWTVYRGLVEKDTWYEDDLDSIARSGGFEDPSYEGPTLRQLLDSKEPLDLMQGIEVVAGHWGWDNFDSEPLHLSYAEIQERYDGFCPNKLVVPRGWPVQPLKPGEEAKARATCGTCGRSWDDGVSTSMTPTPSGRCPFEDFHMPAHA